MSEPLICCICKLPIVHMRRKNYMGNNAVPVAVGRCCDTCDWEVVVPARIHMTLKSEDALEQARRKQIKLDGYKIARELYRET